MRRVSESHGRLIEPGAIIGEGGMYIEQLELHLCTLHLVALGRVNIAEMITSFTCIYISLSPFDTYTTYILQLREMTRHQKPSWQV